MDIILNAAGGLALFLLAMSMMTDGLKVFGGQGLKVLLRDWTSNAFRGVFSGALVTAIVQSSSAVTVATIGFVNAGVLSLRQALGVIFGTNVGTTMTGWLVSILGFGFKIEALALPILAVGVGTRLLAPGKRFQGLGQALAGFGLFFLGLAILKDGFSGIALSFGDYVVDGELGLLGLLGFLIAGFMTTVLSQSSSASIAIIIIAAAENAIGIDAAATAIIGANVGTTSTAMLATIGATPNAKRVAAGHVLFNIVTGAVALLILPVVLVAVSTVSTWAGVGDHPAPLLALFHTGFNLLGVFLLLPFVGKIADYLDRMFHTDIDDISRPQYLDNTILSAPSLAIVTIRRELSRLLLLVCELAQRALITNDRKHSAVRRRSEAVSTLGQTIQESATSIRMESLPRDVAEDLPRIYRIARYLEEAARLTPEIEMLRQEAKRVHHGPVKDVIENTLMAAADNIALVAQTENAPHLEMHEARAFEAFQESYQKTKNALLSATAAHALNADQAELLLDSLSRTRRMVDQIVKASRMLQSTEIHEDEEMSRTDPATNLNIAEG